LVGSIVMDSKEFATKLLVDIGNSDAIWLFKERIKNFIIPEKNFEDYLGKGFSGDVLGRRARIDEFLISDFKFNNPIAAFPDSTSLKHIITVPGRMGSVGGEIFKRFSVVFDYSNQQMYLKRNSKFKMPFTYNKSGIEIRHIGMQWVKETIALKTESLNAEPTSAYVDNRASDFKYMFQLKPVYEIVNVRKNSPAQKVGLLKGDVIVSINNEVAHKYSLQKVNALLKSDGEKWITIEVERDSQLLKFTFVLLDVL
jgi:membrane-associated protease RseP (regulator of RpoE activity)